MKKIILTVIITLVVLFGGFFLYISSGAYNISQLDPHIGFTKSLIKRTTHSSIERRMGENEVPKNFNSPDVIAHGFRHYDELCVACHAAPGIDAWEMREGLYPKPPFLYKKKDEDPQEFFWIIKNGVKLTSMPAYSLSMDDEDIWAMTAFIIEKLPKMSAEEYAEWRSKSAPGTETND